VLDIIAALVVKVEQVGDRELLSISNSYLRIGDSALGNRVPIRAIRCGRFSADAV
jgi:hypothetical protein